MDIDEIDDMAESDAIDHVADRTANDQDKGNAVRQSTAQCASAKRSESCRQQWRAR
jgi:hypothetical protein